MTQRRKRLLTVEAILDAALVCIDESGQLTMAALAKRLGTTASSVYHHLDGRPAIVDALRQRVLSTVELPLRQNVQEQLKVGVVSTSANAAVRFEVIAKDVDLA